jgi:hypothetical protein
MSADPASLTANVSRQMEVAMNRERRARISDETGMTTAEYAIGTLAACGFAALLVTILRSGEVQGLLLGIVRHALALGG